MRLRCAGRYAPKLCVQRHLAGRGEVSTSVESPAARAAGAEKMTFAAYIIGETTLPIQCLEFIRVRNIR
jgi:hypothetical protein